MSTPYSILEKLPPIAYTYPEIFKTGYDTGASNLEQFNHGLEVGREAESIHIDARGCWGAHMKNGGVCTSYEGIGYHRSTGALLKGFLESGCPVFVNRFGKNIQIN